MIKKRIQALYVIFDENEKIRVAADRFANARGQALETDTIYAFKGCDNFPSWKYLYNGSEWVLTNI